MALAVFGLVVFIVSFLLTGLDKQTKDQVNLRPAAWATRIVGLVMVVAGVLMAGVVMVPTSSSAGFAANWTKAST
jgi:uncharacterized Tic20 family protein